MNLSDFPPPPPRPVRVLRDVPADENYSGRDVKAGETLYLYLGHTYGCIRYPGVALSERPNETPFFEFPGDAIEEISNA